MGEKDKGIKTILWVNVRAMMVEHYGEENLNRLARDAKLGPATVARIKAAQTSVGVDIVARIAKVFRLEPYQLLCPAAHNVTFSALCRAYNETDNRGREILNATAEAVLPRAAIKTSEGNG